MNKYKMIAICSLSIVCILILSLLLPLTTSANDKESIELKMHYENSKVTVNIAVNSEVYTGVVCKYIEVDNVLTADNLSEQTQQTGATLNLNKTEDDKYTTTIENVSKRYVVVYVSIGNCDICDYIDCNLNTAQETSNNNSETNNQETVEENVNSQDSQNDEPTKNEEVKNEEAKVENENTDNKEQSTSNQSDKTESADLEKSEESENNENINQNNNQNNEDANNSDDNKSENGEIVVKSDKVTESTDDFQTIDENSTTTKTESAPQTTTTTEQNKEEAKASETQTTGESKNQNSTTPSNSTNSDSESNNKQQNSNNASNQIDLQNSNKDTVNVTDKDSINTDAFEEIKSVDKTISTADTNMPQTGENDFIKIIGIVIFSIISVLSFYKYKKTK